MNNMNRLKIRYRSLFVALSLLVMGATAAFAQQEGGATTLSLQECREMALENNIENVIVPKDLEEIIL